MFNQKQFILSLTTVQPVLFVEEMKLHIRNDLRLHSYLWQHLNNSVQFPAWAYYFPGGQAIARYIFDNPEIVENKDVLDFAAGSGIAGIAASMNGAESVVCVDINELFEIPVVLNAEINNTNVTTLCKNLINEEFYPEVDLIISGDPQQKDEKTEWLANAKLHGKEILVGSRVELDDRFELITSYNVPCLDHIEQVNPLTIWIYK